MRHFLDIPWHLKFKSAPRLCLGNALVARCLLSLRQRNIPIWRETGFKDLIKKGMIFSPEYGLIAFTVPLFDEFMRRATGRAAVPDA